MKTIKTKNQEMRKEYRREDLENGVRGKYFKEYQKGTNLVLISPDVAVAFPDEESVNTALRSLLKLAQNSVAKPLPRKSIK